MQFSSIFELLFYIMSIIAIINFDILRCYKMIDRLNENSSDPNIIIDASIFLEKYDCPALHRKYLELSSHDNHRNLKNQRITIDHILAKVHDMYAKLKTYWFLIDEGYDRNLIVQSVVCDASDLEFCIRLLNVLPEVESEIERVYAKKLRYNPSHPLIKEHIRIYKTWLYQRDTDMSVDPFVSLGDYIKRTHHSGNTAIVNIAYLSANEAANMIVDTIKADVEYIDIEANKQKLNNAIKHLEYSYATREIDINSLTIENE